MIKPFSKIVTEIKKIRFSEYYRTFFSLAEIEKTTTLQWTLGAFLLSSTVAFRVWITSPAITKTAYETNQYSCWPYFQNCGEWYFLEALPYGYSQTTWYAGLLALIFLGVFLIWKKQWFFAHLTISLLWLWKMLVVFVLSTELNGNHEYYDIILGAVLLFLPYKEYFLKLVFVLLYFLASTIKFDGGWIVGTYLTSLHTGMPIFGNEIAPLVTNIVIFMQVVGCWFLLSSKPLLQRSALVFFVCFHFYSAILVGYRYPITALPFLLILFGPLYKKTPTPFDKKALWGSALIFLLAYFQGIATFGSPDRRNTLENNRYGLSMFEANHQCISRKKINYWNDKNPSEETETSRNANIRCDPFLEWFTLKQACTRHPEIKNIEWSFDHSINGGAFYRIVETKNTCELSYKAFGHNQWIKSPKTGAPFIGYPFKNYFR